MCLRAEQRVQEARVPHVDLGGLRQPLAHIRQHRRQAAQQHGVDEQVAVAPHGGVCQAMPIQQWVLSLPPALRILCAFRPEALTRTLHAFVRAVFAFQRRRAALTDTANAQPELAGLIAESVSFPKGRVVDPLLARSPSVGFCGVDGFNLHAGVAIGARDSAAGPRRHRPLRRRLRRHRPGHSPRGPGDLRRSRGSALFGRAGR